MSKEIKLTGRRYDETEREVIPKAITSWREKAMEKIEGEREKTDEELKMIKAVMLMINAEMSMLGVEGRFDLDERRVHFLPETIFKEKFGDESPPMFAKVLELVIYINDEKFGKPHGKENDEIQKIMQVQVLLHEALHLASHQKHYVGEDKGVQETRSAYGIRVIGEKGDRKRKLEAFNEVVIDLISYDLLANYGVVLEKEFGIGTDEYKTSLYSYGRYSKILEDIVYGIAKYKGKDISDVWRQVKRGLFTGEMIFLKDIDRVFGRGSLRFLTVLGMPKLKEKDSELINLLGKYFSEKTSMAERQNLANEINSILDTAS